jgi:1-acyl-sn-glycerol-3-phosphate acyltransferase
MKYIRAAIRFPLFVLASFGSYGVWWLGAFFIPNKVFWRQIVFKTWARIFVFLSGMKIEIIGNVPKPPFFLVSNHLGYVDIPLLRAVCEGVFVAKAELDSWFLAGKIIRDMGQIFINRQNRRDIPRAGEEIIKKLSDGEGVMIFPEGTSTKGETVLPFNSSFFEFAARTDLPVSYVSISYKTPADGKTASETVCWWDDTTFLVHLWRLFQMREFTAVLNFGEEPVLSPNRKELARRLWEKVSEGFIPVL